MTGTEPTDTIPTEEVVRRLQKELRERSAIVQALQGDLMKSNRVIHPQAVLLRRVEFLIDQVFNPAQDEAVPPMFTDPNRLLFELGWLTELEELYRAGLRETIVSGAGGLIVPGGRT